MRTSHRPTLHGLVAVWIAVAGCLPESSPPADATAPTVPTTRTTLPDVTASADDGEPTTLPPLEDPTFEALAGVNTVLDFASSYTADGMELWEQSVEGVEDVRIISTLDGAEQPALWVPPRGDRDRPLLVVLHSWSATYQQHASIPFAMWAQENGWAVIAPHFRGVNDHPDAMGSDLAVQDVVDAIDYAVSQGGVDQERVYTIGFSGGGMMSLLLAGRHPDRVTAAAAWTPVYDLIDFYRHSNAAGLPYTEQIRRGCGGSPASSEAAEEECLRRSPMNYLDAAQQREVPVFIGQGLADSLLPPSQSARAFNQLADPEDRLTDDEVAEVGRGSLPDHLDAAITTDTHFGDRDPAPVFARRSGSVLLVLFQAGHEMVYAPALHWFATDPR